MAEPITQEKLAAAIFKAKGLMENAVKASVNPHFKSSYADFGAVRDATMDALTECELSIEQRTGFDGDGNYMLFTWFQHTSGAKSEPSMWPIIFAPDKPQVMGSSLTYGRRYQWGLVCGIASEVDDDGEKATRTSALADPLKTHEALKAKAMTMAEMKKSGIYATLERECRSMTNLHDLQAWWAERQDDIKSLPTSGRISIESEKGRKKMELRDAMEAANGDVENNG